MRRTEEPVALGDEWAGRDAPMPGGTPRSSAAALRASLADGWASAPALSSRRRAAPRAVITAPVASAPRARRPAPGALDRVAAAVASLFGGARPSDGQSYDQYMETHESPKRVPLADYETTASTEEKGPTLGRDGAPDPAPRVVSSGRNCGCAFELFGAPRARFISKPGVRK